MPFLPRLTNGSRSLRFRLTAWHTLVLWITVIAALLAVREGLRFNLLKETDVILNDEARELLLAVQRWHPAREQVIAAMQRSAASHADRGWYVRWLSPDRKDVLWESTNSPGMTLVNLESETADYKIWASETRRAVERRLNVPGLPGYYIRVGTQTQFIEDDVRRLTQIVAPIGLCLCLLAPLGGFFLSERAVRPLQEIIRTTERLHADRLHERLPVRGVGDELDQLATKINQFLDLIADHLRQNREFVTNAAHELRSPLTAMLSSIDVDLGKTRTPAEQEELLVSLEEQCRHLTQLVNQLLTLAESEREGDGTTRAPISLEELAHRSVEMFAPIAEERGIAVTVTGGPVPTVLGHAAPLRQVVTNLLDNALKFTPGGGRITLSLSHDRADNHVELAVQDTGMGIPAQDLPRIFERFYQVDKARHRGDERRGYGLGLSICQAIIQRHRGRIDVESSPGTGSAFRVRLPAFP